MKTLLLTCVIISVSLLQASAQCLMTSVPLNQRILNSTDVIEGKVINKMSFWNPTHTNIYTSNLVEVYKSFKNTSSAYIEVITEGGTVGNSKELVRPSLELAIGDAGIFTLNSNALPAQFGKPVYEAYASAQGFIKYNAEENEANEPFKKYLNLSATIYSDIQQLTQANYTVIKPANPFFVATVNSTQAVAAITGFSPTTITAGTFSVLTINGSAFGATQGTSFVEFKNADDGGSTYIRPDASQYVSWSATQIQVIVPTTSSISATAGSGTIRIDVGGVKTTSTSSLTVQYAHINVFSNGSTPNTVYNTRHVNKQSGGYVWQMYTTFDSNAAAKASFLRAFQSWRCGTYINWTNGAPTTVNAAASDGTNVIRFDVGTELPAGVLGRCTNYFSGCGAQPNQTWFVNELDIVFDSGTSWYYGTGSPGSQMDFESVAVHELGHGHELGHVIKSSEIMNYSIGAGQSKRVLSVNDLAGGNAVMARNATGGACAIPALVPLTAGNCVLGTPTASFTANRTTVCPGQTVVFTNLSTGSPTLNTWTFAGGTPATSTVSSPTITYNTPGSYSVQLVASNSFGSNTYSVVAYINVTSPATLPLTQTFQSATYPPTNWYTTDAGNDNIKWKLATTTGYSSTQSTVFDNWSDSITPSKDELKTYVNLTGFSTAKMTFYRSYSQTFISPYIDTLQIGVSINCGTSTVYPYLKGGSQLATANTANSAAPFTPTATTQWVKDSIDLTSYVGQPNVMVAFTNRGHYGDAVYLDNINITGVAAVSPTTAISSASTGCTGTPITLTDASTGGPNTWTWTMTGGAPASANTQNTSVTYTTAGVKTITLTVANASGTTTVTKSITITATPTVAASVTNTTICSGASIVETLTGATTYAWLPSGSGSTSTLTPASTTIYTITGSTSGCTSAQRTVTINVTPTPTTNATASSSTICSGQTTTLTASGATSYSWAPGAQTTTVIAVTPTITTTYTVKGTSGTCSSNKTITVNVTATPSVAASITNTTICSGTSIVVNVNGATTYTWLPSGSGATSTLTPASTTVYTVTGKSGNCNSGPKNFTLTVTPTPTTNITSSSSTICAGQTVTLTASGAASYSWTPGTQTTTVVTVAPIVTTTYTVKGTNATCSSNKTVTVNVTSTPTITTSITNTTICSGKPITVNINGATSYTWLPSGSGSTSTFTPASTTIYTVTGSTGSCNSVPKTFTVNVSSSPVLTNTVTNVTCFGLCNGATTVSATGGTAPYAFTVGQGTPICAATTCASLCVGVYTLNATDVNGCSTNSTITINQPNILVASVSNTNASCSGCSDGAAVSNVTGGTGAYTYVWQPIGATTSSVANLAVGCYTLNVTDANNCMASASTCISFGTKVTEQQNEISNLIVFPNPGNGLFTISNTVNTDKFEVIITNTLGQTIMTETGKNIQQISFDLRKQSKGIYYAKVTTTEGAKLFKLILE
jgi:PKD repeat protein